MNFLELCVTKSNYGINLRKSIAKFQVNRTLLKNSIIVEATAKNPECDRCGGWHYYNRWIGENWWEIFCASCGNTIDEGIL
jgi:hypothetical protein